MGGYVERIQYWLALAVKSQTFTDAYRVGRLLMLWMTLTYRAYERSEKLIAYCISDDMLGGMAVCELFMYIKPEYRGNIRLFKELVQHLEDIAKENNCSCVKIASNIGYNDDSVLKILQRWGYKVDTVTKRVN